MQTEDHPEDESRVKSEGMGKATEVEGEQLADFSTEIMSVTEMEQSPDNSPGAPAQEEKPQDSEMAEAEAAKAAAADPEPSFPPEFEKFWKVVETNPQDFTGWVYLLQYVEQEVSERLWVSLFLVPNTGSCRFGILISAFLILSLS